MYCNTIEITHIRVTRMMVDINGKRNMRIFIIHIRESWIEKPLEDGCCAMPLLPGTIMSRLLNRHHQFDINLTSKTGCNGWAASGHWSSRQAWMKPGKTPPEKPQFRMTAEPLFHHLARKHSHVQVSTGTTILTSRQATADAAAHTRAAMKPAQTTPPPTAATSQMCWESAVSYWHTTKHELAPAHNCHHPLAWESHHLCS